MPSRNHTVWCLLSYSSDGRDLFCRFGGDNVVACQATLSVGANVTRHGWRAVTGVAETLQIQRWRNPLTFAHLFPNTRVVPRHFVEPVAVRSPVSLLREIVPRRCPARFAACGPTQTSLVGRWSPRSRRCGTGSSFYPALLHCRDRDPNAMSVRAQYSDRITIRPKVVCRPTIREGRCTAR